MHPRSAIAPLLACLTALAAAPAQAAVTLELVSILAEEGESGWRLWVELEGSYDVTSAALTPPGRPAFALACGDSGEGTECGFESGPVATLAALLAAYPSGQYQLSLNGGERVAGLAFTPVAPDGLVTVTSPGDGEAYVAPTPGISWTHDCTNCVALAFDVVDVAAPIDVGLERFVLPAVSPGSISWSQLESYRGPKPTSLPDGVYGITASTAVGEITTEQLTPGNDGFEYSQGALRDVRTTFTVPEPGALASGLAVLAALAGAARRARPRSFSSPGGPLQPPAATSASSISIQPSRA